MSSQQSELLRLANDIQHLATQLVDHLAAADTPEPDFSPSSSDVPTDPAYNHTRNTLNDAANDLLHLINGPKSHLQRFIHAHNDLAAYQIAFEFDFFAAIPENDRLPLAELAELTVIDEDIAGRVIRLLCTQRVFKEVDDGVFAHSHVSATFARNADLKAAAGSQLDEIFKAASESAGAVRKAGKDLTGKEKTPFEERFGLPVFEWYKRNPPAARRFAAGMGAVTKLDHVVDEFMKAYPWQNLTRRVVDVGGGSGHITIALARAIPTLQVTIQDVSPSMLEKASKHLSQYPSISSRIRTMQYDFFDPQPVPHEGVGAFFLRHVLHNWDDADCVRILRNLVPVLENCVPGTPVLLSETIIPEYGSGVSRFEEHGLRQMDVMMFAALGAKQRSKREFETLVKEADSRLEIVNVFSQGTVGLLEVHLKK